jgi:hypothetical protein
MSRTSSTQGKRKQATPLTAEAIAALRESSFAGNAFHLKQDKLPCYSEIKALVETLGGKWKGKQGHVFSAGVDARALILGACDRGEIPPSNPLDFYPTPPVVVEQMVDGDFLEDLDHARNRETYRGGDAVHYLEPSAGAGALAAVLYGQLREQDTLTLVEMNPILAANLRQRFPRATVIEGDFQEWQPDREFTAILMNPPFAGRLWEKHVQKAFSHLTRFGILISVAPLSEMEKSVPFLMFALERGTREEIEGKPFEGVSIPTCIFRLENDPAPHWLDQPHQGFQTGHAFSICLEITQSDAARTRVSQCTSPEALRAIFDQHAKDRLLDGNYQRMSDAIAADVESALRKEYELPPAFERPAPAKPFEETEPEETEISGSCHEVEQLALF